MRPLRLLVPLTLIFALGSAAPAMAVDWPVEVVDFEFNPGPRKIDVGDKVVWNFAEGDHSTTSVRGQPDSWNSNVRSAGSAPFERVFTKPGRYQYFCIPHESFMRSTIEVGEDAETDTVDSFKSTRRSNDVTIAFKLNEAAKATYKLTRGPSRRTVGGRRLRAGRHSFRLRNLRVGRYQGKLTLVDDFDKKVMPRNFFVIR